jgi:protein tyrosine phosphatase (PTP) superfamily phosphohydrolase (DUF442 family)
VRCLAFLFLAFVPFAHAVTAPNVVPIHERWVTSGQPDAAALATLKEEGFEAVIYLAPPTVGDAVKEEPQIVRGQGLEYANIPIVFDRPTQADFDAFAAAIQRLDGRKVLVHCQINLRASSMTFLHRVIVGREPADKAYDAVARVWSPNRVWKAYIAAMLKKHDITFEPY